MLINKRIVAIALAVAMIVFIFSSCSTEGKESGKKDFLYSFSDSNGHTVIINKRPKKVAILFSSYADIWKTAGGTVDITVGEAVERGFAEDTAILVDDSVGHSSIDTETLTAEKPDLVIGTSDYDAQVKACEYCDSIGIPSALFKVENLNDYLNVLEIFCNITGDYESYQKNGVQVKLYVDSLLEKVSEYTKNKDEKNILFIRAGSSAKSTKAKNSSDNFACTMIKELGMQNIADNDTALLDTLSLENILVENPDYIFITTMGDENAAKEYVETLFKRDGWKDIDAVKNNEYYFLPKDLFHYKPNSRWAEAYTYLVNMIYPDLNV